MRLTDLTWPKAQEYFEKNDMVLISIGSIECHGRHMPLGTDTLIPDHLLEKIEKKSDVLIAPTIPYGSCQSLAPYPGTIDIDSGKSVGKTDRVPRRQYQLYPDTELNSDRNRME